MATIGYSLDEQNHHVCARTRGMSTPALQTSLLRAKRIRDAKVNDAFEGRGEACSRMKMIISAVDTVREIS